jgi:hypothetical protein
MERSGLRFGIRELFDHLLEVRFEIAVLKDPVFFKFAFGVGAFGDSEIELLDFALRASFHVVRFMWQRVRNSLYNRQI